MPELETTRLQIRPMILDDLESIHQLNQDIGWVDESQTAVEQYETIHQYVHWSSLNHVQLARLHQPPYGDRSVCHKETGDLIGICGLVPYVADFSVFPSMRDTPDGMTRTEMGLMWAISPAHHRLGYATEVARALIDYAFTDLRLHRIIATTGHKNIASQGVMRKAGMRIEKNPFPDPPWLQVIGIAENERVVIGD
jgi:RimJ/RimL family protein N-acetyltransferase